MGIDLHSEVLAVARENALVLETEDKTSFVLGDVNNLALKNPIDTVVSNPPFGVKKRGADMVFLRKALSIAKVIYSIHLVGPEGKNRPFLNSQIKELGGTVTQIENFQFPIRAIYERHQKQKHLINVDLYRVLSNL